MNTNLMIALIAAVGENGAIGLNGGLPWHLHNDTEDYRRKIMGYPIIMGRRTYQEINTPYANPLKVVVSSTISAIEGVQICPSVESGISLIRNHGFQSMFVIGGENIYREALKFATDLYITHVDAIIPNADTFFPEVDWFQWIALTGETRAYSADAVNDHAFKICHYVRNPHRFKA